MLLSTLIMCSGCGKADISDARRDHIMAGNHGWIDITFDAGPPADPTATDHHCSIAFFLNGEVMLNETADIAAAAGSNPTGYRFPAPSGTLNADLQLALCTQSPVSLKRQITLGKDQLLTLHFDGKALLAGNATPYLPTTLEQVRSEISKLQNAQITADGGLVTLKWFALASLFLNTVLVFLLLKRRIN
jgi:hypothetical protein